MVKITVQLINGYKMRLSNKDTYLSCYYTEDDWDLEIIEEDLYSLKKSIAEEVVESGIIIGSQEFCFVTYIRYKDHKFIVTESEGDLGMEQKIMSEVLHSDYFLSLKKEKAEKLAAVENQKETLQRMKHIDPASESQSG